MPINLKAPQLKELKPRIVVCGVGGAGGNAINNMIASGLSGVDFVVANTDAQALSSSRAQRVIQMGLQVTEGLGAGSRPEIGKAAAEETLEEIRDCLAGSNMVFLAAGMGGGTGTGAAPNPSPQPLARSASLRSASLPSRSTSRVVCRMRIDRDGDCARRSYGVMCAVWQVATRRQPYRIDDEAITRRDAIRFCYEARTARVWDQRQLTLAEHDCADVAPSLIPCKPERPDQDRPARCDQPRQAHRAGDHFMSGRRGCGWRAWPGWTWIAGRRGESRFCDLLMRKSVGIMRPTQGSRTWADDTVG